ncbi:MAG: MoaD/ThiS family protein [Planctomycetes bacterium]|nr:MoaD/ThiS family protein [Planctomycetota bacterium]MCB9890356.1 MoaD/ThiS family protein [Planctomycetota bacterium]MCB9918174.1 MoaD/ThiS family protein [Planctomycetota bacterium]
MVQVSFTPNLGVHVDVTPLDVDGRTVREALEAVFRARPRMRGYVLDDQGRLRAHVNVFVSGQMIRDRDLQSDAIDASTSLWVFQALSGG